MTFEDAKRAAIGFLNDDSMRVINAKLTKRDFVFFFDTADSEELSTPGAPIVTVDRQTGHVELLEMPSIKGFAVLDAAMNIM